MKIGLISDTHGVFAPDVKAFLEPVDQIWHAGDFGTLAKDLIDMWHPDIFICGHTHIPQVFRDSRQGFLFMNPGASGYQGSRDVPRMALRFDIVGGKISNLEKCEFPWPNKEFE